MQSDLGVVTDCFYLFIKRNLFYVNRVIPISKYLKKEQQLQRSSANVDMCVEESIQKALCLLLAADAFIILVGK